MAADRRWIILAQDGLHVTMGRAAPPSEAEVKAAVAALAAQGLAAWLATLDGDYWSRRRVALAPVQMLGDGTTLDWPAAITAFEAARQRAPHPLWQGRHRHHVRRQPQRLEFDLPVEVHNPHWQQAIYQRGVQIGGTAESEHYADAE
jgi:hypothetical protein